MAKGRNLNENGNVCAYMELWPWPHIYDRNCDLEANS